MTIDFSINSITLKSGKEIILPKNGVVVIVGPNNSGKSTLLHELYSLLCNGESNPQDRRVLGKANLSFLGEASDLITYLESNSQKITRNGEEAFLAFQANVTKNAAEQCWRALQINGLRAIAAFFCFFANTETRLGVCHPANAINFLSEHPSHPIHVLKLHKEVELRFSDYCRKAFGQDLIVNHGAGGNIPLLFGKRPNFDQGEDRVDFSYLQKLQNLPFLHSQGDGIRSFVGCLLSVLTVKRFITLLDEPEAFLHPPQSRLIGRLLAAEHGGYGQVIISTHSSDFIKGMLEGAPKDINILRLTRDGDINQVQQLDTGDVVSLWDDPILRFSNILDGIFHEGIVISEDDADCRFYSAITNAMKDKDIVGQSGESESIARSPEYMFASSGGKSRIHKIIKALKKLKMKIKIIADFDVLSDSEEFKRIFAELGGEWSVIDKDYKVFSSQIGGKTPPLVKNQVVQKIQEQLDKSNIMPGNVFEESVAVEIKGILKKTSAWAEIKKSGASSIPSGEATQSLLRIFEKAKEVGFWIVPVGEMESFDKTISNHGYKWVAEVLKKDLLNDRGLETVRQFVKEAILE